MYRSENLFEALEKRDLTDKEKLVIEKRVAHQRKMLEIYEKQEKQRKISELCELCPDLSKEEAEKALEWSHGREDEAAASLVSDPGFKRRIRAALSLPDPNANADAGVTPRTSTRHTWAARPNDGCRPKVVDPTTLGDSVFVGAFRGKGFQGASKGIHERRCPLQGSEVENQTDNIIDHGSHLPLNGQNDDKVTTPQLVKSSTANAVETTPDGVSREYILVKETGNGKLRPVTDSEMKKVFGVETSLVVEKDQAEVTRRKPTRTLNRPAKRQRIFKGSRSDVEEDEEPILESIASIATLNDSQAVEALLKMSPDSAASVLQSIAQENAERAVALREGLDEVLLLKKSNNEKKNALRNKTESDTPSKSQHAADSEATVTENNPKGPQRGLENASQATPSSSLRPQRPQRPQRAAKMAALTKGVQLDDIEFLNLRKEGKRSQKSVAAVSFRGHTNRGRVKQKSHKSADIIEIGRLHPEPGWYNSGYIFPIGFHSRTLFRSSVALDQLCVHECFIEGSQGKFWPSPTFKVVALDRPDEPLVAKSCTGCWTAVLKRINAEINARREAGEDLPPPPKTAIAGPEYFGLNQPNIQEAIEELDPDRICIEYWAGKDDREKAVAGLPSALPPSSQSQSQKPKRTKVPRMHQASGTNTGRRRTKSNDCNDCEEDEEDDETRYVSNRWSAVNRAERYKRRLEDNGGEVAAFNIDDDNPLPDVIDPITLEPVIRPAISPFGHVMGAATWKAVLAESGLCPFTKKPLRWEQCRVLTVNNIEAYKDKIIR